MSHVVFLQQFLAEAEVGQFNHSIVEEDVCGLEVPVEDVLLVEGFEGVSKL